MSWRSKKRGIFRSGKILLEGALSYTIRYRHFPAVVICIPIPLLVGAWRKQRSRELVAGTFIRIHLSHSGSIFAELVKVKGGKVYSME